MRKFIALVSAVLTAVPLVFAQGSTWVADKAHSQVKFSVSHMVVAEVTGRFTDFDITLKQGNADFTGSTITATIKTASVNTDNEKRDAHLRSDDFFNAAKFPEMKFVSKSFEKTGKDTYKITGDLTIRDVTKTVELDTRYNGSIKDPWGTTRAGFKATTIINRTEYGAKWNKVLEAGGYLVGENVEITLLVEFQEQK